MKLLSSAIRNSLFAFTFLLALPAFRAAAQSKPDAASASAAQAAAIPARITQAIDEAQLVRLKGNVHPLARPEFDQGIVPSELPVQRMLLLLKRSMEQESALAEFMLEQHNAASPNYHKWLTPEQFGAQFGPADADIQTVIAWLQSHGFQVAKVSKGKIAIEFSGTASQVSEAFHTEIHKYVVNGEAHFANTNDPQIPAALTPAVHGLAPLNNFRAKPAHHVVGGFTRETGSTEVKPVKPEFTTSGGSFAIGPTDFATIYDVLPLWNTTPAAIDGTGQSIAIIGTSNINQQDITDFRTLFGLPTGGPANTPIVVIDGADPGIINDGSETEALLDVEWSGAIAKGAQIHFVIAADTDIASGFILAIFHVIDNNSDPILSLSFGSCEPNLGTNGNNLFLGLWEQAAAQGITVTVAAGDPGSAGCEDQNAPAPNPATTGLQVSGFASTPFNVAVGGTDFNDAGTQSTYFKPNAQNDPNTLASAISYIPESTWNESCTNASFNAITGLTTPEANCNSTNAQAKAAVVTVAGSGGPSHCFVLAGGGCSGGYTKPAYQSFISAANGMPAANSRNIPDVSLFASSGFNKSFYALCEADHPQINPALSCKKGQSFQFLGVGGTSASAPSFAGIMALVNQKNGRQGNANFALYKLAQTQYAAATACNSVASPLPAAACTFNDVTTGTIAMPCTKGSLDCTTTVGTDTIGVLNGYGTTAGYDLATGLGSVNANNLVNNWGTALTAFTSTTTTLTLSPLTGITAGQNVTVNVTVAPGTGTAKPTGDVALVSTATTGEGVDGFTLDSTGKVANGSTNQLTGGTYQVTARYGGDGTFAPSVSAPVTVTVGKAASSAVGSVLVSVGNGNFATFTTGQAPVTLFLQATINPNGALLPTGTVSFVDTLNGTPTTVASNVPLNSAGEAFTVSGISTLGAGNHSVVANYGGDASFNVSSSAPVTFTITAPAPSITSLTPNSGPVTTPVTIAGANFGATQGTSTVKFNGTAATPTNWSDSSITAPVPAGATTGNVVVTVGGVASNGMNFTVTTTGSFTISYNPNPVVLSSSTGASVMSAVTVTPTGGFTGTVTVVCPTVASLPPGVSCTAPAPINITSASPVAANLTLAVTATSTTLSASAAPLERTTYAAGLIPRGQGRGWWGLSAVTGMAALVLLLLPGRKRFRAALGLGLVCVFSFTLGCGGSYGGGGGGGGGPVATITHITVTSATKGPGGTMFTFTATVTGGTPTGQVQLLDGGVATGAAVTVSGGTATLTTAALSTVGTHTITASYAGNAAYTSSSSGPLNVTVTGNTTVSITTNPAATPVAPALNVTVN